MAKDKGTFVLKASGHNVTMCRSLTAERLKLIAEVREGREIGWVKRTDEPKRWVGYADNKEAYLIEYDPVPMLDLGSS